MHQEVPITGCPFYLGQSTHCQQSCLSRLKGKSYDTALIFPSSLILVITYLYLWQPYFLVSKCVSYSFMNRIPFLEPFISSSLCTLFTFISGHWECCCSACSLACGFQNLCLLKYPRSGIPDHLTCLLRNLYTGQVATVRTGHETTNWVQIGKGVRQGCILSPCLLNLYAKYIMRNAGLEEAQAGIKIAGRNINNFRYTDDTTLWQKVKRN